MISHWSKKQPFLLFCWVSHRTIIISKPNSKLRRTSFEAGTYIQPGPAPILLLLSDAGSSNPHEDDSITTHSWVNENLSIVATIPFIERGHAAAKWLCSLHSDAP